MSGNFIVGQPVLCIAGWNEHTTRTVRNLPIVGQIYTVRNFSAITTHAETGEVTPSVRLLEIVNPLLPQLRTEPRFDAEHFISLDEAVWHLSALIDAQHAQTK